jgi:hypothetical protein
MKTGIKKMKNKLLFSLIGLFLVFHFLMSSKIVLSKFPPFIEGRCFGSGSVGDIQQKVIRNNLFDSTTVALVEVGDVKFELIYTFGELRDSEFIKLECKK